VPLSESHREKVIRAPSLEALETMAAMMEEAGWERTGLVDAAWHADDAQPICWEMRLRRAVRPGDDPAPMDAT
jgi:hypothetical protein